MSAGTHSGRDWLPPLFLFFACTGSCFFLTYRPFETSARAQKHGDPVALIQVVREQEKLRDFIKIKDPSVIFLPTPHTVGVPSASAELSLAPGIEPYSPFLHVGDPWNGSRKLYIGNFTELQEDAISSSLLRRPMSTFGKARHPPSRKTELVPPTARIYVHGEKLPTKTILLPPEFFAAYGQELWGAAELVFTLCENVMAGPPTPAKSSGSEAVDDALIRHLMELESSLGLRDGYYRFVVSP